MIYFIIFTVLVCLIYRYEPKFDIVNGGLLLWYTKYYNCDTPVRDFKWIYRGKKDGQQ